MSEAYDSSAVFVLFHVLAVRCMKLFWALTAQKPPKAESRVSFRYALKRVSYLIRKSCTVAGG